MTDLSASLVIGLLCCVVGSWTSVVRYDQSQSGDVNVQVQLKNIEVFAILDDALFGEYGEYDYADFTEKPSKPSGSHNATNATSGSSSSTNKPHENDILLVEDIFYNIVSNVTSRPHTNSTQASSTTTEVTTESTTSTSTTTSTTAKTVKRCGSGFYRDTLGRCRRIRRPHLPLFSLGYRNRKASPDSNKT